MPLSESGQKVHFVRLTSSCQIEINGPCFVFVTCYMTASSTFRMTDRARKISHSSFSFLFFPSLYLSFSLFLLCLVIHSPQKIPGARNWPIAAPRRRNSNANLTIHKSEGSQKHTNYVEGMDKRGSLFAIWDRLIRRRPPPVSVVPFQVGQQVSLLNQKSQANHHFITFPAVSDARPPS